MPKAEQRYDEDFSNSEFKLTWLFQDLIHTFIWPPWDPENPMFTGTICSYHNVVIHEG